MSSAGLAAIVWYLHVFSQRCSRRCWVADTDPVQDPSWNHDVEELTPSWIFGCFYREFGWTLSSGWRRKYDVRMISASEIPWSSTICSGGHFGVLNRAKAWSIGVHGPRILRIGRLRRLWISITGCEGERWVAGWTGEEALCTWKLPAKLFAKLKSIEFFLL